MSTSASASSSAAPAPVPAPARSAALLSPAERKAQLVERIERQRLLRQTRRLQAAIAELQAGEGRGGDAFPRSKTLRLLMGQPLLAMGSAGLLLMLGPARLLRLGSWVLPMLLRRR